MTESFVSWVSSKEEEQRKEVGREENGDEKKEGPRKMTPYKEEI